MNFKRLQAYFFIAICLLALVFLYLIFKPFLVLTVFSGVLAILAWPVHTVLTRFFRGNVSVAAGSTVFLTLMLLLMPLSYVMVTLVTEVVQVFTRVRYQVGFDDVETTLTRLVGPEVAHSVAEQMALAVSNVAAYVQPLFASLTSNVLHIFSNTVAVIFGIAISLLGMYYLLKDGPALKKAMLAFSPLKDEDDNAIFDRVQEAVRGVAIGSFSVAATKGLVGGLLLWALGMDAPVFWGAMIAVSHYIPGIGTAAITLPFAIYLFVTGHFIQGLVMSVVSVAVIGLVDNVLGPLIIRTRIQVHPFLILLSILGGLAAFGAVGVFFGPIMLAAAAGLADIYHKEFREYLENLK